MSNWYLIALVALAVAGILLLLYRNRNNETSRGQVEQLHRSRPGLDYAKDREDARLANMSTEDRAWETSSLQRNLANQERSATPAE